jgi:hypothetical protein
VGVYVDDLINTGSKDEDVEAFKEVMKAVFQMSDLGPLSYLRIEVTRIAPGPRFDRRPTPSASWSWQGSLTATQLSLQWRRGRS